MEAYSANMETATEDREGRRRLTGMLRGKTAMAGMSLVDVREAISRARRKDKDAAGRQRRMDKNVADLIVELLTWEGSGELDDFWLHRSSRQIAESPAALTPRMLETARRNAAEEGLLRFRTGYRPSDRRPTTFYRLDMWQLARVVNRSELEEVERVLRHETRERERDGLNKKRRALEAAKNDLDLIERGDSGNPKPVVEPPQVVGQPPTTRIGYRSIRQEITSVDTDVSTPVVAGEAGSQAGETMKKVYNHLKGKGYRLDNGEYRHNLKRVESILDQDDPTEQELEDLPEACLGYFEWHGSLDAAKALRRARQQASRAEMTAREERGKGGRHTGAPSKGRNTGIRTEFSRDLGLGDEDG